MQALADITTAMEQYRTHNGHYPDVIRVPQALVSEDLERWCLQAEIRLEVLVSPPSGYTAP